MAYDEELAQRFRSALEGLPGISETKMMGGVCFMLDGNMIGGAQREKSGRRRFLFRVGKENRDTALSRPGAQEMEMRGRPMAGFIFVEADDCDDEAMREWMSEALAFVTALPPKAPKPPAARPRRARQHA